MTAHPLRFLSSREQNDAFRSQCESRIIRVHECLPDVVTVKRPASNGLMEVPKVNGLRSVEARINSLMTLKWLPLVR